MEKTALAIYQPLIVGLGAVVLGLVANTLLEWFRHALTARHQRAMTRRALIAELQIALATATHNRDNLREKPANPTMMLQMPIREDYPAFKWAMPTLALLSAREISAVFTAYDYLNSWPEIIAVIGKLERHDGRLFAHVPVGDWETVEQAAGDRIAKTSQAIDELSRHRRVKSPSTTAPSPRS